MSLYIKLQVSYWSHRKTLKLRSLLGDDALWIMPRLWSWAAQHQPDGNLSSMNAGEIALSIGYSKDANALLEALQQAGFMHRNRLESWEEHNAYHTVFAERASKGGKAKAAAMKAKLEAGGSPTPPLDKRQGEGDKQCLKQAASILEFLNLKAGTAYRAATGTLSPIVARLKDGATEEDCRLVIEAKTKEWKTDPQMNKYLRPGTLFRPSKFEDYLGLAKRVPKETRPTGPAPFPVTP